MAIELRNGRIRARVRQKSGTTPFYYWDAERRADAERWHEEAKKAVNEERAWPCPSTYGSHDTLADKDNRDMAQWTIKQAWEKQLELEWTGSASEKTYYKNWKQIVAYFGANTFFASITVDDVDAFVAHLKMKGNSGATINRKLSLLSKIWKTANERRKAPARVAPWPRQKESQGVVRFWNSDEERRIFKSCSILSLHELKDYLIVLLDTGIRRGEAGQLNATNVLKGSLLLTQKNTSTKNHTRSIPLTPRAQEVLDRRAKLHPTRLFPHTDDYFNRRWDLVRENAQVDGTLHIFRHTFASRLAQAGASIGHIQDLMGHATHQATMIYAHLCTRAIENTMAQFMQSEFFNGDSHKN